MSEHLIPLADSGKDYFVNSHDAGPHEPSPDDAPGERGTGAGAPAPGGGTSPGGASAGGASAGGASAGGASAGGASAGGASGGGSPAGGTSAGGSPAWRQLSFRASGLTIELEITGSGGCRRLAGQLVPRQSAAVEIRTSGGVITVEADSLGRFSADTVPLGPVSLRCRLGGGADRSPVVTGWVTL